MPKDVSNQKSFQFVLVVNDKLDVKIDSISILYLITFLAVFVVVLFSILFLLLLLVFTMSLIKTGCRTYILSRLVHTYVREFIRNRQTYERTNVDIQICTALIVTTCRRGSLRCSPPPYLGLPDAKRYFIIKKITEFYGVSQLSKVPLRLQLVSFSNWVSVSHSIILT